MRILFMGTPEYAKVCLESIINNSNNVVAVVTQPDKQKGRGMNFIFPPVKEFAINNNIPVYQPTTLKNESFLKELNEIDPELIIVAAYGKILPKYVLEYPKFGCINAHASLLPKYRGAAPIQRAIMNGETETGVCSMVMEEGLDTGDIILKDSIAINDEDDYGIIHDKLSILAGELMSKTINLIKENKISYEKQDDSASTYANKITKEDSIIDFTKTNKEIHNQIRALSPTPYAQTLTSDGKILKFVLSTIDNTNYDAIPGTIVNVTKKSFTIACGKGGITIHKVLPEGKKVMDVASYLNGRKLTTNDKFN